jgi:taurine dioxygenase
MGSILYIQEVPPEAGGDTMFANMYAAYESLSEPMRNMLGTGRTALNMVRFAEMNLKGRTT